MFAINFASDSATEPEVSVVVINTAPNPAKDNALAHGVASILPSGAEVWIATSAQLIYDRKADTPMPSSSLHAILYGGMQPPPGTTGINILPDTAQIADGLLAALLHFIQAMHFQCCCLVIPGMHFLPA